ncbi:hypothetical protein ABZZ79_06400 [Streptomyces sp. NPDC006458]|uniref:hypothetical protein n=1 Tax=Streptomyces sp. NPDC006458 TaxID=3154302 RepID=UPI0033A881F3
MSGGGGAARSRPAPTRLALQIVTALGEVALLSRWTANRAAGPEDPGGLGAVQNDAPGVEDDGHAGRAGEEDGGVQRTEAVGRLLDRVERGVAAADVAGGQALTGEGEARRLAEDRLDLLAGAGSVDRGDAGQGESAAAGTLQLDGLPVGTDPWSTPGLPPVSARRPAWCG